MFDNLQEYITNRREKMREKQAVIKNNQRPKMISCIILSIFFFISFLFWASTFSRFGGFAGMMILLSILFSVTSFVFIFVFKKRSKVFAQAIKNNSSLGIFSYKKNEWQEYLDKEVGLRNQEKKFIFIVLSAITTFIFFIVIITLPEGKLMLFLVLVGLIALYAFMAFIVPVVSNALRNKNGAQVIILDKSIILDGTFHTWDFPLSKLATVKEKKTPFRHMQVSYDFFDRLGPRSYIIRIPFPKEEQVFKEAMNKLKRINNL